MKTKNVLLVVFAIIMNTFVLSSCSKDEVKNVLSDQTYEYHLYGIVNIDDKMYELPSETGTLQVYGNDNEEWNHSLIFTSLEGNKVFTAKGSYDGSNSFFAVGQCSRTITIDGETFTAILYGNSHFDKNGNITMKLSLYGNALNNKRIIYNQDVNLVITKR